MVVVSRKVSKPAKFITKRDGRQVGFETAKVISAVKRCFVNGLKTPESLAERLAHTVSEAVENIIQHHSGDLGVEDVQRYVIQQLWAQGHFDAAEHYQNYRQERARLRKETPIDPHLAKLIVEDQQHFPTDLQYYQFISKFSRWNYEESRRETWKETCFGRVLPWLFKQVKLGEGEMQELSQMMYNLEASPAMRVVQMAGPALDRCHVGVYNCASTPLDDFQSFAELLYVLMQGTGCSFSVEEEYVCKLPRIKKQRKAKPILITPEDDTEGWCDTLLKTLNYLFDGYDVQIDPVKIRPANTILRTKGGRSSGPGPLLELISFIRSLILARQGQFLEDIDVHDLGCMIGRIVQVGGVRRAACLSHSDLWSTKMREAKSGNWYNAHPHRTMANNSAAYEEKPSIEVFTEEWLALMKSKSGERGIFSRYGVEAHKPARRKSARWVTNPCVVSHTWILTSDGPRQVKDLVGKKFYAVVDSKTFPSTEQGFFSTGVKPVFDVKTLRGYILRATNNHRVLVVSFKNRYELKTIWKRIDELQIGDEICLSNHRGFVWAGKGTFEEGWVIGSLLGDGVFSNQTARLSYWGDNRRDMLNYALDCLKKSVVCRSNMRGARVGTWADRKPCIPARSASVSSVGLASLARSLGLDKDKRLLDDIERTSSQFHRGFLRGWFDADGSVEGHTGPKGHGISVRLSSVILTNLQRAQRMLGRLGIISKVYKSTRNRPYALLPDGRGGKKYYACQEGHYLVISGDNLSIFDREIGFTDSRKASLLKAKLSSYDRSLNRERFLSKVVSINPVGEEEVYDCTIEDTHEYSSEQFRSHNCGEILFRPRSFCNLSIAVARPDDTIQSLRKKVRAATLFGLIQSTCTKFGYLREEWKNNAEEERLLGVDITGHADCPLLRYGAPGRAELLRELFQVVQDTKSNYAPRFGINLSAADTCVKPGGDSAVFFNCASGVSPWFSDYQMRYCRERKDSPVACFLRDSGVPHAPAPEAPGELMVFGFPRSAPKGATTRNDLTSIEQFYNWLEWKKNWAEHSVSATIYVDEHEWLELGALVYKHFDEITGLSFLPKDNGIYQYPPNQELSKEEYDKAVASFPQLNWAKLMRYEVEDYTEGSKVLACTGGTCEL